MVINPNWQEADQLARFALYKRERGDEISAIESAE